MTVLRDLIRFLLKRKKYWLVPVLLAMLLVGGALVFLGRQRVCATDLHDLLIRARLIRPGYTACEFEYRLRLPRRESEI